MDDADTNPPAPGAPSAVSERRVLVLGAAGDGARIAAYLRDDASAVTEIHGWIVRAATSFRRRLDADWDDAVQEAQLTLTELLQRGLFRGEAQLRTYVWRVTTNVCLRQLRRRRRHTPVDALPEPACPRFSALEHLLARETRALLLQVLERVPADCRRLWDMVLAGLDYRAMSARTGVGEGALRVRVLRCRRRALELREQMLAARRVKEVSRGM